MAAPTSRTVLVLNAIVTQSKFNYQLELTKRRLRARKRAILLLTTYSVIAFCSDLLVPNPRSIWVYPRSSHWWEDVVLRNFSAHDWMENFRVSRDTFQYLCDQLRPLIRKQDTRMRKCVSTERRVAITLWVLATPSKYRSVAHLFGLACCTVCKIVNETCRAIIQKLLPLYVRFPTVSGLVDVVRGFKEKFGIPQCAGSIDGSHVPITPPSMNHTDYYNRKGWYSMLVQAVVDHNYLFRDLCVGWPGSVHDTRVLANSTLFRKVTSGDLLQGDKEQIEGRELGIISLETLLILFSHG